MREIPLTLPEIGMINSTRFIIGTGAGLLLARRMDRNTHKAVGISLLVAGILFSIPAGWSFLGKLRSARSTGRQISEGRAAA
jgi:hypothetical protein